jgi:hypothetical protein
MHLAHKCGWPAKNKSTHAPAAKEKKGRREGGI